MLSVIIPANNEAEWIGRCLVALFASNPVGMDAEAIVVANGCNDDTVAIAKGFTALAEERGWRLVVLDLPEGSKPLALNRGDQMARGTIRAYLDADVAVTPALMAQIVTALSRNTPAYASGTPSVSRAHSLITRAYARFWSRLPFMRSPAPGFGLYAVNALGRARWTEFPPIISDDTFVRLQFTPEERIGVTAGYRWPMIEGFGPLVRVRRRQDVGVAEIARLYPGLMANEGKVKPTAGRIALMALRDPVGFLCYTAVSVAVRLKRGNAGWVRGR